MQSISDEKKHLIAISVHFSMQLLEDAGVVSQPLLEFIRLVLRRDKDIHKTLTEDSNKYYSLDENDSLLNT